VEQASGAYIAFVDSDDFVSIDWFRVLVNRAQQENADITIGNTIHVNEAGWRYVYNTYYSLTRSHKPLENEAIIHAFLNQEGSCFLWHTVWNKIYSRALWDRSKVYFKKLTGHIVMTEDMAFSTVFFFCAKKLIFVDHDGYFYYRHGGASTSIKAPKETYMKHLNDIDRVFHFIEEFLKSDQVFSSYQEKFTGLKDRYFRIWSSNLIAAGLCRDADCLAVILKSFDQQKLEQTRTDDFYFYGLTSTWDDKYENLKLTIFDQSVEVVSFDIFDTMLIRPFLDPKDLFYLIDSYYNKLCDGKTKLSFYAMRCNAEESCRIDFLLKKPAYQDVTLDEIYDQMKQLYQLDDVMINKLLQKELELELRFCKKRKATAVLFDMAKALGKKIILISDMYLPEDFIKSLLDKNGYFGYDRVFVSSKVRLVKATGELYRYALNQLGIKKQETVLHIGDNWNLDVLKPRELKMRSAFLAKTKEVLFNEISDINTGNCAMPYIRPMGTWINYQNGIKNLSIKCMLAVVANEMFDNPFRSFYEGSDFNADAYFIGYYALGMHLFGLAKWLIDDGIKSSYDTLHFLARDGYLPKKIYDILSRVYPNVPKSDYLHVNRKLLLQYTMSQPQELYSIIESINYQNHTPREVLSLFEDIFKPLDLFLEQAYYKHGILLDKKIHNLHEMNQLIQSMIVLSYDQEKLNCSKKKLVEFIQNIVSDKDAIFDIGYSGRLPSVLTYLAKRPIDSYYIHSSGETAEKTATHHHFTLHCFYEFTPSISGVIREYFISDYHPPCVRYQMKDGLVLPVFEKKEISYQASYPLIELFEGATDFAEQMVDIFGTNIMKFTLRPQEVSAPFEFFLASSKEFDRSLFSIVQVEDEVYDGYKSKSLFDIWSWNINQYAKSPEGEVQSNCKQHDLQDLYLDGLFVAFYQKINKLYPKGSKRREQIKRFVRIFLK
ncbi:MAG: HAD-IA family hydrolase, partial [Oscillospiraceae bacterium]